MDVLAVLLDDQMSALLAEVLVSHRPSKAYSFVRFEIILIAVGVARRSNCQMCKERRSGAAAK